ncbi:unnamed protein product [Penicillium pancosmium]
MSGIVEHLTRILKPPRQVSIPPPLSIGLGALACIGLLYKSNSYLSRRALNSPATKDAWDWDKEIVVVTGGSSGIGAAIVKLFAEQGIKTIGLDLCRPHPDAETENAFFYQVDLTNVEHINRVADRIRSEHGNPTVLINNAGIQWNKPILELPRDSIHATFEVNIISNFLLVKEFLPAMVSNNHGHVVTVASLASFTTRAVNVDYACTKSAALAFHEGLGQELRHIYRSPGVRTTIIHPGWVKTPLIKKLMQSGALKGHLLEPEEVAEAILKQLRSTFGAQIFLPSNFWILSLVRGAPSWIQERIRNLLTTSRGYDHN